MFGVQRCVLCGERERERERERVICQVFHTLSLPSMFSTPPLLKTGRLLHSVHRQQTLVHLLCVTLTQIITGPPDTGLISIASYW